MNVDAILSEYNIFVTGISGFIGTVLLQRLLSIENGENCKIFCLLRTGRRFNSVSQRMRREILSNEILGLSESAIDDLLVQKRVVPLEGELTEELLGLDPKTMSTLKYSHSDNGKKGIVVIHCAADIDFNRELNQSIDINVNGTFQCIRVGQEIGAKSFIHISTLYVNSREHRDKHVLEQIYESGIDFVAEFEEWLRLKQRGQGFDECRIRRIQSTTSPDDPSQRAQWPNSYTFSKNMAENVVLHYCGSNGTEPAIPCSIVRLGIVSPICKGEHLGWFMGNGGFVFLVIGIATGNIRYLHGDGHGRPDFVPVDYTCDAILAATARTIGSREDGEGNSAIYQCGVIDNDPSWTVHDCVQYIRPRFLSLDLPYCKKNPNVSFIESYTLFYLIELLLYEIPLFVVGIAAYLVSMCSVYFWYKLYYRASGLRYQVDVSSKPTSTAPFDLDEQIRSLQVCLFGKEYNFVKRCKFMQRARGKMNWFNSNYSFFVNQRWRFDHSNVKALYRSLDAPSRRKYDFNVERIDFNKYACEAALVCFRKYIEYREEKKRNQMEYEAALQEKLEFLEARRRSANRRYLSAEERKQIIDLLRNLFFMVGLDAKVTVGIVVGMSLLASFSFLYR